MVTKKKLLTAIIKFVKNEVIPHISEKPLKMVLSAAIYTVDSKPDIIDPFLNNPVVAAILQGDSGEYDTALLFGVLDSLVTEYGGIPVTIPPIKFITSTETTLTFYSGDVEKLKWYVMEEIKDGNS